MSDVEPNFNLIDTPWIPMLRRDGQLEEVSLVDAIARAGEFTQIVGEVPTQVFAIQRLLLAVLHRAVDGPRDLDEWQVIREDWLGTVALVRRYLDTFRDRFFLFHPTTPFFQVADLRTTSDKVSGLEKLVVDVPNGAPFFTTRLGPGLEWMPGAEAARWLVHVHAFDPSGIRSGAVGDPRVNNGKVFPVGTGWSGQIGGVLVVGNSMLESLQLNLVVAGLLNLVSDGTDLPPWERPQLTEKVEIGAGRPEPRGIVDLYTWQTRRVRLVGDAEHVTGVVLCQGDPMTPHNRQDIEPMTAWRYSEPQTKKAGRDVYMPRQHDPERQFWRGLSGLLPMVGVDATPKGKARFLAPTVVTWIGVLVGRGWVDAAAVIRLRATGIAYGSNNSVVDEIVDDTLTIPASLLGESASALGVAAIDAVERAEEAARVVADLARNLSRAAGADTENDGPALRAREKFYANLDAPFRSWLLTLDPDEPATAAAARWQAVVRQTATAQAAELLRESGPAAWVGREVRGSHVDSGKAEAWFWPKLDTALPRGRANEMEEEVSA